MADEPPFLILKGGERPAPIGAAVLPGATIGILGGGQLGRMMAMAAAQLGYRCHIYAPEQDSVAAAVSAAFTCAEWHDSDALARFVQDCDVVTWEFENVPVAPLAAIPEAMLRPHPRALEIAQDRLLEKRFIEDLGGRPAPYAEVDTRDDLARALDRIGAPGILKTRREGYDGKGQWRIASEHEADALNLGQGGFVYEGFVKFEAEFSVILVRGADGEVRFWDCAKNVHVDGILTTSTLPASAVVTEQVAAARELASAAAKELRYVGVLTFEFFATGQGPVFNEMAPRVHNSGHWTIEGAATSQFENHIRAICGLPLGDTATTGTRIEMTNLVGRRSAHRARIARRPGRASPPLRQGRTAPGPQDGPCDARDGMTPREITFIVARADNGIIARDGQVPWQIKEDLKRFVAHTTGTPMIMGRKTFESFPQPLKGRRHIVLTRDPTWQAEGAEIAHSLEEALVLAGDGDISVIGGADIFELFMPFATRIELTEVHEETRGDVSMPYPGPEWREVMREEMPAADGWPPYAFVRLEKSPPMRGATRIGHQSAVPDHLRGAIIALGNFDGFHLGHQAVVREAVEWARAEGRPAIVATFDPHPVRYFAPHIPPFRLTTLDQREELFLAAGADAMLVFHFGAELAETSAEDFVSNLLGQRFGAAGVVTGEDFTFGKGREGDLRALAKLGAAHGIAARAVGPVMDGGQAVSSSRIRDALKAGDCAEAARLLTRPFAIRGTVQHGEKRGRDIGFPTANMALGTYLRPRFGIYAVTARIVDDGTELKGAANLGVRPHFDPPIELLEPHFFDFTGDLYGREIEIAFRHFLRPEAKFDTLDALIGQIGKDCERAKELLG